MSCIHYIYIQRERERERERELTTMPFSGGGGRVSDDIFTLKFLQ